jgi:transcriptional regulator with XRE-family HTH domain
MSMLGRRIDAAIKASGKTGEQIAREAQIDATTISRLRTGKYDNPELQLLIRFAQAAKTTVGALLGESIDISAEDEDELLRFRGWIDEKLTTIDAGREPNATIVTQAAESRGNRIAERPRQPPRRIESPFDADVHLVLRAVGESMVDAGILPDDILYATAPPSDTAASVGTMIACRIGEGIFVKRLVSEHSRLFLLSAHPRYRPIAVDPKSFEVLGTVIGRVGSVL